MFDSLFARTIGQTVTIASRTEGAAFLKAARDLYDVETLAYACFNIPVASRPTNLLHCCYSDTGVRQCTTDGQVQLEGLSRLTESLVDWDPAELPAFFSDKPMAPMSVRRLTFPLASRHGETAMFGLGATTDPDHWEEKKAEIMAEIHILGDYLHSHILRISGHDTAAQMLVSARELDCLKWAAAGKTAWEASKILGITERTVRFHLNTAREKLDCATTTQAVAKAISHGLIKI